MTIESVRRFFEEHAPDIQIIELEESTATVQLAAQAHQVAPGQIAKTLSLRTGDRVVLVVACGDSRLDNKKLRRILGGRPKMLATDEVAALTGHPVGGVCPFGLDQPLPVYCDIRLRNYDIVMPAAGSHNSTVRITPARLAELTGGRWVDICQDAPDTQPRTRAGLGTEPEPGTDRDPDNTSTAIARMLAGSLQVLAFPSASHVYNPLIYMWAAHREYLQRYGSASGRILLVGMNPGPWGMAQTGVPFGEVAMARDWLKIEKPLGSPLPAQHEKYPIAGFACHRSEGSGDRFWGWARQRFDSPGLFFQNIFVWNYCPLLFLRNNRNLVPEQLHKAEREPLFGICDAALDAVIHAIKPRAVVGIGRFAHARAQAITGDNVPTAYLLHPSPANPAANRGWADMADRTLAPWL